MKILHTVELYHPSVGGMQEVVKQLSERLVRLGHQVTVATTRLSERSERSLNGVHIEEFSVSGNLVSGMSGELEQYQSFLLDSTFDVITNFAAQQWATDVMITMLDRIMAKKVFVPTGFSGLYSPQYRQYFVAMSSWMKQYDMNVFLSDDYRDINFARENGVTSTLLIPNGASKDEFMGCPATDIRQRLNIHPEALLILHVGSHTGLKGHEEAMEIFRQADIHDATLLIVGNEPIGGCASLCRKQADQINLSAQSRIQKKQVIITPLTRSETVSAYHSADLFLFPSNIECSPIVLFECMASRTPFLVTDVGNSAEIVEWSGGAGIVMPTDSPVIFQSHGTLLSRFIEKLRILLGRADDFSSVRASICNSAALLETLCQDATRREEMEQAGYLAWKKRFTWEKIAEEYEKLYLNLVAGI